MTQLRHPKRLKAHDLAALLATVPHGRRRVAEALVGGDAARTYGEVADLLGVHLGTVHTHLCRLRLRHPEAYAALMAERRRQLDVRHQAAVADAEMRSWEWHRRQANRRYRQRFGYRPWEAPRTPRQPLRVVLTC